jgi:hypothetical protein
MNTQDPQIKPNNDGVEQGEILPPLPLPQTQAQSKPPTEPSAKSKEKPAFDPKNMASLAGLDAEDPIESAIVTTELSENIDEAKTKLPI